MTQSNVIYNTQTIPVAKEKKKETSFNDKTNGVVTNSVLLKEKTTLKRVEFKEPEESP